MRILLDPAIVATTGGLFCVPDRVAKSWVYSLRLQFWRIISGSAGKWLNLWTLAISTVFPNPSFHSILLPPFFYFHFYYLFIYGGGGQPLMCSCGPSCELQVQELKAKQRYGDTA